MTTTDRRPLSAVLHPRRFSAMSSTMAAIVGCIIGERFTRPALAELHVTVDGMVLARAEDDCGCNEIIGSAADLERNWQTLLDVAGLSQAERAEAEDCYRQHVTDWRRVPAGACHA